VWAHGVAYAISSREHVEPEDAGIHCHEEGYFVKKDDVAGDSDIMVTAHDLDGYVDMFGPYVCGCSTSSLPF
jgi:hypothetical protein